MRLRSVGRWAGRWVGVGTGCGSAGLQPVLCLLPAAEAQEGAPLARLSFLPAERLVNYLVLGACMVSHSGPPFAPRRPERLTCFPSTAEAPCLQ